MYGKTLLFFHNIRCILLANLEPNTAQVTKKASTKSCIYISSTLLAYKLSAILPGDCVCIIDGDGVTVL